MKNYITDKAAHIMDIFEDILEEHDITIPSDDREGEESEARLYGTEYYNAEDKVKEALSAFLENSGFVKVCGETYELRCKVCDAYSVVNDGGTETAPSCCPYCGSSKIKIEKYI